jgi:hypothetical protein
MRLAAKEEMFSTCSDPCVLFPLAAFEGIGENSRLGSATRKTALHRGTAWSNSARALGIEEVLLGSGVGCRSIGSSGGGGGSTVRATPTLKFKPPSWQNFTHEFLPCYGAQLVDNLVGDDDKALVTFGTVALTVAKPLLGGSLLVVWTGIAAFSAGSKCAVASRGYYQ